MVASIYLLRPDDLTVIDLRDCSLSLLRWYLQFIELLGLLEGVALSFAEIWEILRHCWGRQVTVRELRAYVQHYRRLREYSDCDSLEPGKLLSGSFHFC